MNLMNKVTFLLFALIFLVYPVFASAQADLEYQIRAILQDEARSEGMSDADFSNMVSSLASKAQKENVTPEAIAQNYIPTETAFDGNVTITIDETSPAQSPYGIYVLFGVLFFALILRVLWSKMEKGGALGSRGASMHDKPTIRINH